MQLSGVRTRSLVSPLWLVELMLNRLSKPVLEEKPTEVEIGKVGLVAEGKGLREWKL